MNRLVIEVEDNEVFDRFKYWLSDVEHEFSEDCEMGDVIGESQYIEQDWNGCEVELKKINV